jgi:5-methylcytosine-specific restriction protein A
MILGNGQPSKWTKFYRDFWDSIDKLPTPWEKIKLLKHLSEMPLKKKVRKEKLKVLRNKFERKKQYFRDGWKVDKPCRVCKVNPSQHRHHIIPLSRNGTNSGKNIIGLCEMCHSEIHPWLKSKPMFYQTVNRSR